MIPENVAKILEENGLRAIEFEPGSTPTSVQAAEKLGVPVGNIAKSLLFVSKNREFYLFVCPGDRRVTNAKIRAIIGGKARMATADETIEITGFRPGAVCPFGLTGVKIHIDTNLRSYGIIYPAAGTDGSGVPLTVDELLAITGGIESDCTE